MNRPARPATVPRSAVVVGGGVVGVSAAYALLTAGVETTLVTAGAVADGATSTNGGLIVPADSIVWPSPDNARTIPLTLLGLGSGDISVEWRASGFLRWGVGFLAHSTPGRYRRLSQATHALSRHSLAVVRQWTSGENLRFDFETNGMAFLFKSAESARAGIRARAALADVGERYRLTDDLSELHPSFALHQGRLVAVLTDGAAHGDARDFTVQLAGVIRSAGGTVCEGRAATRILLDNGRAVGVGTPTGAVPADIVVLAAGFRSRALAATAGVRLPVLPVKGYAATIPILHSERVSQVGGVMVDRHIAFSRTASHLRVSTGAEIGAADEAVPDAVRGRLRDAAQDLFPDALDLDGAHYAAGHRPMTPSGLPLVGPSPRDGLFLDTGHGSLGWTQAAGSGQLLADIILCRRPQIDIRPYQTGSRTMSSVRET